MSDERLIFLFKMMQIRLQEAMNHAKLEMPEGMDCDVVLRKFLDLSRGMGFMIEFLRIRTEG